MSPPSLRRYRAERLLRRDFVGLRAQVLAIVRSRLRTQGVRLDAGDLDACYSQAWSGLYATVLDGEQVDNPAAWLVLVTFRRAIDESRATARRQSLDGSSTVAVLDPDLAGTIDDRAKLQQLLEGLRGRLSERECQAASLCYLQGLSRSQAAARLGLSEARMRKLMDGAGPGRPGLAGKVGALLDTIQAGGWCEQQGSLMRAYAFGILDPDGPRHALAVLHCRECPACRAHVATLRGLAAVLPPLPLRLALAGAVSGAAAGSGSTVGSGSAAGSGSGGVGADASSSVTGGSGTAAGSGVAAGSGSGGVGAGASSSVTGGSGTAAGSSVVAGSGVAGVGTGLSTATGWTGPLVAKLLLGGVLALAVGGYVGFGGGLHHRQSHSSSRFSGVNRVLSARSYPRLYEGDFGLPSSSARPGNRVRRHIAGKPLPARGDDAHGNEALAREFGPEHVPAVAADSARPSVPGNPQVGTAGAAREFGFE